MSEPVTPMPGLVNLEAAVLKLTEEVVRLKALTLHMCADCHQPTHECVCSEAVNANTAIKEG